MLLQFGRFELDLAMCELRMDGAAVPLQPRVFGTLRYLVEHRDRVVSKQELIEALWGGHSLNPSAVPWAINQARKALDDLQTDTKLIETVRGHGYRFAAAVRTLGTEADTSEGAQPTAASGPRRLAGPRPFVGREIAMTTLEAAADAAAQGRGRLVLLTGEVGIGKTRCVEEFSLACRRRGAQVWIGRCIEHAIAPAFWPHIQILRAARGDTSLHESLRREATQLLEEFERRPAHASRTAPELSDQRFWWLDRLTRWLCKSATGQLRVLAIEDAHSADAGSLSVLSLLAPMLQQSHLLVVVTAREPGIPEQHRSAAALAARLRPCDPIALSGLCTDAVETYLRSVFATPTAVELAGPLTARTSGNPLVLEEVVRVVSAQREREGRVSIEGIDLPVAVKEVMSEHVRVLPEATRALLDAASVIGQEFRLPVLQRIAETNEHEVLAALHPALRAGIVTPRPDKRAHIFTYPLLREVLYENIPQARRAQLHAAAGLALEALGVFEPALGQLAYHFHYAPLDEFCERAERYGRMAGDAALSALAYDEAVQFYAWARQAQLYLSPDDTGAACELMLRGARALALAGREREARRQCRRAIELASQAGLPDVLVSAARQLRPWLWLGHVPDRLALQTLERALTQLPDTSTALRSRVFAQLAALPPYSLSMSRSCDMSATALRLAEQTRDSQLVFDALRSRLYGLCGPDTLDEQQHVAERMLTLDPSRVSRWTADAHYAMYRASMQRGDAINAERALSAYAEVGRTLRLPLVSWHSDRLQLQSLLHAGQLDQAEHRFATLLEQGERLQVPLASMYRDVFTAALHYERTGLLSGTSVAPPDAASWAHALPMNRVQGVLLAVQSGDSALAERQLQLLARDDFAELRNDLYGLCGLAQLGVAAVHLADSAAAARLCSALAPHAELIALNVFTLSQGCISRYLGVLQRFLERPREARASFELAIELNARAGHALERLRAMLGLAELFATGLAPHDRLRGRELAAQVEMEASVFGARSLVARARALQSLGSNDLHRDGQDQGQLILQK